MNPDGTGRRRVAGPGRFGPLVWSPDGTLLAHVVSEPGDGDAGIPGAVTVADDLGWRHLSVGEREGELRQLHVLDPLTGEDRILPLPDLDVREVAWSPDGAQLVVSAKARRDLGRILNTELWIVPRDGARARRLTRNPGPDTAPLWISDQRIACLSHPDSLQESRPAHIVVRDRKGHEVERLITAFDNCVWGAWHHDGSFYFRGAWRGSAAIFRAEGETGRQLTPRRLERLGHPLRRRPRRAVGQQPDLSRRPLRAGPGAAARSRRCYDPNERWYDRVSTWSSRAPSPWRSTAAPSTAGSSCPPDLLPGQRVPTVLCIHGGPEWMYGGYFLPEFHVLPRFGYAVLAANPTGSTGYGLAFQEAIRGDWVDRPAREVLACVDHAVAEGWADPERLAVMGGSYGGHLGAALTTQTDRFRAAAAGPHVSPDRGLLGDHRREVVSRVGIRGPSLRSRRPRDLRPQHPFNQVDRVTHADPDQPRSARLPLPGQDGSARCWFSALQSLRRAGAPAALRRRGPRHPRIRANQVFYLRAAAGLVRALRAGGRAA